LPFHCARSGKGIEAGTDFTPSPTTPNSCKSNALDFLDAVDNSGVGVTG
jgi:hypothetical protein